MQYSFIVKIRQWLWLHPWDTVLILAVGAAGLCSGLWIKDIILDDAMITFRVAENLARGQGFVYNVGERVQVSTTPLYVMVLAAGTWVFGSAPDAAFWLNLALATLIPILAYDVGRRLAGRITGVGSGLLLTIMPLLIIAFSMESYLYVGLILASMDAYISGRYRLAGIVVGITALVRGDAVLMGASMLTYDFLAHRRLQWRLIIPAISIPSVWYIFSLIYYGSPFPATLQAKTAQGEFNWLGDYFLSGFFGYWERWLAAYGPRLYLFPVLLTLGLIEAVRTERLWLILIARDVLYISAFVGLGVTFAEWYYAPLMAGIALLTARGIQLVANRAKSLTTRIDRADPGFISIIVAAALIILLIGTIYPVSRDIVAANPDWKAQVYPDAARWLRDNTTSSANLATIDIGHLGYWSKRHIIDIVGLAQPDVAAQIAKGDFGYAIRRYEPDMVLIGATWLPEIQGRDWFQGSYIPRHALKLTGIDEPLVLFTKLAGVKVQPVAAPPDTIQPLDVDFNRQITLTGFHSNAPISPGQQLHLTLYWQVEASLEVDFTVFVQLVDAASSTIRAQGDNKPQRGLYTTPFWQPGEVVIDPYTLQTPGNLSAGNYDILVGFYEADSGIRLQVLDESGSFKSDHARLRGIRIQTP